MSVLALITNVAARLVSPILPVSPTLMVHDRASRTRRSYLENNSLM
jgi:hypothetical protein